MRALRKGRRQILVALVVLGMAVFAARALAGPEVAVHVVRPRELVQTVVATGRVLGDSRVEVGSLVAGRVAAVHVEEGATVQAGDGLVQLDDTEAQAAVAEAQAALAAAEARLAEIEQVQARLAAETLREAEVNLTQALTHLERVEAVYTAGGASRAEVEEARRQVELARSRRDQAAVQARSQQSGGSGHQLAEAELARARAALAAAEARLAQLQVRAPVGGVVLNRQVEVGDAVQPGQVMLVLAASGETRLVVEPDEENLPLLAVGQPALVSADAYPGERFTAKVTHVAPGVDPERGTVEVRLRVPNPPPYLRPDMTVSVEIQVARREEALVVPADALRGSRTGEPAVWVVADGRVTVRTVEVGIQDAGLVEVRAGLQPDDMVLAGEAGHVEPGQRVRVRRLEGVRP